MPNTNSVIQFKYGLQTNFDAIAAKDANTVYFTTDEQRMFVGDVEYTRPVGHGDTLPTGYNPPNSIFIKELASGSRELYYSKDGAGWELISSLPAAIAAGVVGANASTTPAHGGNITIPKITYDAHGTITDAEDQTIKLPGETAVSVTAGTEPTSATALTHGGTFTVVSDVSKGSGSHTVVEKLAKFQLPEETGITVDSPAATAGGALTHGGSITVVTGVTKGDSSHNIDITTETFTLPTETSGTGSVTGSATSFVKTVSLGGHKLSGTVQAADTDIKTGTGIPTTAAVKNYVDGIVGANDAMIYKGVLAATASGIYTPAANCGDTYKISAAGKINGQNVEVGDMIICTTDNTAAATSSNVSTINANWNIIQKNIDGALIKSGAYTSGHVLIADGTTGSVKDSGFTLGMSVPAGSKLTDTTYTLAGALQSDGTFKSTLTPSNGSATSVTIPIMTAASASAAGKSGLVPAPASGKQASFLRGDGTWATPANTTYTISGANADAGYTGTLKPSSGSSTTFTIPIMGAATADAAGTQGLVPPPAAGKQTAFLRGDGTWVVPTNTTYAADRGISLVSGKFGHSNAAITANTSGLNTAKTLEWGKAVTLNTIKYDAYGHISGTATYTLTMPANPNVDTKVTSTAATTGTLYLTGVAAAGNGGVSIVNASGKAVSVNAATGAVTAGGGFVGNLTGKATKATQDAAGNVITETYATKDELTDVALVWGSF